MARYHLTNPAAMSPFLLLFLAIALPLTPATPQHAPAPAPASPVKEDDVRCLRGVKRDLRDPNASLSSWSWTFTNTTPGAICEFAGVSCWNPRESRVIALELSGFGLQGVVPSSLQYCRSTNTLDLSNNSLSGTIPPGLSDWLPFLVSLDLSGNRLSGPIPSELAKCTYLYSLKLNSNALSGQIPASLSRLDRLDSLDLSNNRLSGPIPSELANCTYLSSLKLNGNALSGQIPASLSGLSRLTSLDLSDNRLEGQIPPQLGAAFPKESFSGNLGLCGPPVSPSCGRGLGV